MKRLAAIGLSEPSGVLMRGCIEAQGSDHCGAPDGACLPK
jgi:hypothetical protein